MADYIFIRKSRNAISSLLHVLLNLLLAVASIWVTVVTGSPLIGLILILVSKWRVFAVNFRYWILNLRSSLVDFIVGISLVLLAYVAGTTFLPVHFVLMAVYAIWLIIIKPKSSQGATMVQALIAVLLGSTAATVFAALTDVSVFVLVEFVIGYAASHHVLVQDEEGDAPLVSLAVGLVSAEITWLSHAWLIIYTISKTGICVSQLAIILTILMFAYFKVYQEVRGSGGKVKLKNVALPLVFSLVMILIIVIGFSVPRFNIH